VCERTRKSGNAPAAWRALRDRGWKTRNPGRKVRCLRARRMTGTSVPALETERLVLRGHVLEDFPAYAAMWADPHVTKFIGGKPLSEEEAWGKFLRNFGQWMVVGFGFWCVVERCG